MPKGTGIPVVLSGNYLRRIELRRTGVLWKSLWNYWRQEKTPDGKYLSFIRHGAFLAP
jgi:hypothetical protein